MELSSKLLDTIKHIDVYREAAHNKQNLMSGEWLTETIVRLAILNGFLSEQLAELENDVNTFEAHYKLTRERTKLEFMQTKQSATKSESEAFVATETELENLNQARYNYRVIQSKRSDTGNLIDALRSRVSYLKLEREGA